MAHTTLAVSETGIPLGVLEQQVWVRPEAKRPDRHQRAFDDKESYKWVAGLPDASTQALLPEAVVISDRESPIYEYMDELIERDLNFVLRAMQGRGFTLEGHEVFATLSAQPVQACQTLSLARRPDRDPRDAQVELRFNSLTLKRPQRSAARRASLTLYAVEVIEPHPPPDEVPVHWVLLTSLPVATLDHASTVLRYYTYRWLIERFHFVLKSGCKLEDRQLREVSRLERLLAVFSQVAWMLLRLTYQARLTPDAPCTLILQPHEWQALYAFHHRSQRLPAQPPSLRQATLWIAQLGGFLARKPDGGPGVKVLWRGWSRLQDIAATWSLLHPPPNIVGNV
jgi:hypothetical protein